VRAMKRWILMGCLIVTMVGTAQAQPRDRMQAGWRWWENPEIRQSMGLTDEQTARIRELVRSRREAMIDLRTAMEKKALLLRDEVEQADFDLQKAGPAAEEFQKVKREVGSARMRLLLDIRSLLNQKQFFKLREIQQSFRMQRFRERLEKGEGPARKSK